MVGDPTVVAMFEKVVKARAEDLFMHLPLEGGTRYSEPTPKGVF